MNLPKEKLLKSCKNPDEITILLNQAERVLQTWQSSWSEFISAPVREEAIQIMAPLNEIIWHTEGGHPSAERQRMLCMRKENEFDASKEVLPVHGLIIEGNFLFEKASSQDFRNSLEAIGLNSGELGDIWIAGDRGAQVICTPNGAITLDQKTGLVRGTQIYCEAVSLDQLSLPPQRKIKRLHTVEASKRIDSIASAGFGVSRSKIVNHIKQKNLRVNWKQINQASLEISVGDRIQLTGKGTVEVLSIELTKRQRWRVELLRH